MSDKVDTTSFIILAAAAGVTCAVQTGFIAALYRKCARLCKELSEMRKRNIQDTQAVLAMRSELAALRNLVQQLEQRVAAQPTATAKPPASVFPPPAVIISSDGMLKEKAIIVRKDSKASAASESDDYVDAVDEEPRGSPAAENTKDNKGVIKMNGTSTTTKTVTTKAVGPATTAKKVVIAAPVPTSKTATQPVAPPASVVPAAHQQRKNLLEHIDRLHENGSHVQAYDELIKVSKDTDPEVLWRLARASHQVASALDTKNPKKKQLIDEAHHYASQAHQLSGDTNFNVLKWLAAITGTRCDFLGTKERIEQGNAFKQLLDKALAMKPDETSLLHMRGRFSYSVASLSWFERKAAAALFSAPPEATYDDAIRDFAAVEKIQPMWLENLLFLAKAYLAKGNKAAAVARLEKAVKGGNDEDSEPMQEARELLKKHRK